MWPFGRRKSTRTIRIRNLLCGRSWWVLFSMFVQFLSHFEIFWIKKKKEKAARPLNRCEYIFDVITELTKLNNEFYLIFKRILWYFPLKLEIVDGYIDMIFNQILPDYVEGLVVVTSNGNGNNNGKQTPTASAHVNVILVVSLKKVSINLFISLS